MLMQSRTQAHIYHLQTTSYAKHIALNSYYENIVDLIDLLSESYQGKYGILQNLSVDTATHNLKNDRDIVDYFEKLRRYCELMREKLNAVLMSNSRLKLSAKGRRAFSFLPANKGEPSCCFSNSSKINRPVYPFAP